MQTRQRAWTVLSKYFKEGEGNEPEAIQEAVQRLGDWAP